MRYQDQSHNPARLRPWVKTGINKSLNIVETLKPTISRLVKSYCEITQVLI